MNNKKNAVSSLILQLATIVQGLVLPKLILSTFGSDVNGLVSSITQFLSFISLLEGGLGAVVLAELYGPIEKEDNSRIQDILSSCQSFFSKLTVVFIAYTFLVACIYTRFIETKFSNEYVSVLVLILSMTTVAQYLFSITYRLLLQAEQKVYIVNCVSAATIVVNTLSAAIVICAFPSIHIVKLCSGIIYFVQPLAYRHFVEKQFLRKKSYSQPEGYVLKNRWSGFAQNLAHFVNMNTDVALITVFMPLSFVSIYSVHLLVINALRGIVASVGNSYQSALGKYIAMGNTRQLKDKFAKFEEVFWLAGMILFYCCGLLINSFIQIYTSGVNDAVYYQPAFSFILVMANMLYVVREPYRLLILAGGKFKETNFGAMAEAVLNLALSLLLIGKWGLVGVAIGTLIAIIYRLFCFIRFLHNDILYVEYTSFVPHFVTLILTLGTNLYVYTRFPIVVNNVVQFLTIGCVTFLSESCLCILIYWLVRKGYAIFRKSVR